MSERNRFQMNMKGKELLPLQEIFTFNYILFTPGFVFVTGVNTRVLMRCGEWNRGMGHIYKVSTAWIAGFGRKRREVLVRGEVQSREKGKEE
jgi:hypothetical protein